MNRPLTLILLATLISGCGILGGSKPDPVQVETIKVVTKPVEKYIYQPPQPPALKLENVKFFVITEENLEQKIQEIKKIMGDQFVVYAITPPAYENLSYNMQELRRYIRQQQEIIVYYKNNTAGAPDDWDQQNQQLQELQQETTETKTVQSPQPSGTPPSTSSFPGAGLFNRIFGG